MRGSSPLTRGKLPATLTELVRWRLIPAHAGKTAPCEIPSVLPRAHPRSRGENRRNRPSVESAPGSSPLTRGKRLHAGPGHLPLRLIPAHAGKTSVGSSWPQHSGAHPRSRGENVGEGGAPRGRGGSSPLTRGKRFLNCAFIAQIDQILESLELCASSEKYSSWGAYATDALQDQARSTGLAPLSSRDAS